MDNFEAFKEFLDGEEIHYKEDELSDGDKVIKIPQRIEGGGIVNVILVFSKFKIKVAVLGIATIEEEEKQVACYKLFNEFNNKYSFFKMYMASGGVITVDGDFSLDLVEGEFQSKELMSFIVMALHVVGKTYRDIMKILWL